MTDSAETVPQAFSAATSAWFSEAFASPTPAQLEAWKAIAAGNHTLVVAPTGSGKTLAAFLAAIDQLSSSTEPPDLEHAPGTRILYVSPLKALAVDVERNLRSPMIGISRQAARMGESFNEITVGVRSGDTGPAGRRALQRNPPDILITTPESLFLMLTSAARETLRTVDTVIIDEIHAVAGSKRGAHLAVTIARLEQLVSSPLQRIGLSATVDPVEEVARFLTGGAPTTIVQPPADRSFDLQVVVPVDDMSSPPQPQQLQIPEGSAAADVQYVERATSLWPHIEQSVYNDINGASSTIVFCNSRNVAERLTARLNEIHDQVSAEPQPAPVTRQPAQVMGASGLAHGSVSQFARAHHGSVSKDQRELIEDDLKSGRLRCVVATSSLELGIDMGAVQLVIQVSAPPSVASGLQRIGRAGHQVGAVSHGVLYPVHRHELVAAAVTSERMRTGEIETTTVGANPLDVLAQQTIAAAAMDQLDVESWFDTVRSTAPFASLPRSAYEATLDLISGRYPSEEFAELRPRVVWDRVDGVLTGRPGAQRLAVTSGGTIPDRGMFPVVLRTDDEDGTSGRRVGELDEEMVYESRINDVIALGATSWRILEITHDRVFVAPAFGEPARLPFWRGDAVGRPAELGRAIGSFIREFGTSTESEQTSRAAAAGLNAAATKNLAQLLAEQHTATGQLPSDKSIVIERFRDEVGDWRLVVLSPYGRGVHAPWALAIGNRIHHEYSADGAVIASDDGIVARLPDTDGSPPGYELVQFAAEDIESIVTAEVTGSAVFASRFRECAARALLLPRRRPGTRAPLWQQRQRSAQLLSVAQRHPTFPILLETAREVLHDVYDLPALQQLLADIESHHVTMVEVETEQPSPFARNLLFGYTGEFLYDADLPLAERRAAALALDPQLLAELLGRTDLRELLDPEVIERTEAELQHLTAERQAKDAETLIDLLRWLGPQTASQLNVRVQPASIDLIDQWLDSMENSRRAIQVVIAGEPHWAAVEDAGRLREALGTVLPLGIAAAHLESPADPVADLAARFARTHGPFTTTRFAAAFGLGPAVARVALARLADDGRLTHGSFLPHDHNSGSVDTDEWVDPEILRRLRLRSLAAARNQVEPVDTATYGRFLPSWQHVGGKLNGIDGVLTVLEQLAGVALPASAWESLVIPARVKNYSPSMLDELLLSAEVAWIGAGSLGTGDGWVQLIPADVDFLPAPDPVTQHSTAAELYDAFEGSGAYLFGQLIDRLPNASEPLDVANSLWDLAWAGQVSSDSFAAVRHLIAAGGAHRVGRRPARARAVRPRGSRRPIRPVAPPIASGRWFAVRPEAADTTTAQLRRAEQVLHRQGVVTRGAVLAEGVTGGFAAMYRVLREMELSGQALRGYFIDTLGAAQFATSAAVDQLRKYEQPAELTAPNNAIVLAATDPANPYGAALPWPNRIAEDETSASTSTRHRPARKAGSLVVLVDGKLVSYVERGAKSVLVFTSDEAALMSAANALSELYQTGRFGRITIQSVNTVPAEQSEFGQLLAQAGFERHVKGLRHGGLHARG